MNFAKQCKKIRQTSANSMKCFINQTQVRFFATKVKVVFTVKCSELRKVYHELAAINTYTLYTIYIHVKLKTKKKLQIQMFYNAYIHI